MSVPRIPRLLKQELEKQKDWEISRGARHFHIRIAGHLAGIIPFKAGEAEGRATKNVVAQVRRVRKELGLA
ncbi:hypothetical protein [Shinella zoogloeoides]|uniref:hypothetical protein n=1 Tax=Shinella zoogloeoides TaxID=352475 RepID=UPI00273D5F12|nr:hypothetical protein [Shinella zoogloeoides]WLR90934.1 hypothetical protein Q9316_00725 [Shinella zoogloeoides]